MRSRNYGEQMKEREREKGLRRRTLIKALMGEEKH